MSNAEGDTTETIALGAEPSQLKAFGGASDKRKRFISAVLASKSLLIHDDNRNKGPLELSFQAKYGTIVSYDWFRGDQFLLGFSNGYVIAMSAVTDLGKETLHLRDFKDGLGDLAVSAAAEKVATCGDAAIKVHDLGDLKNTSAIVTLEEARGSLDKLRWSEDGQFLTVSTKT